MQEYVIGFCFKAHEVLLIYKSRPELGLQGWHGIGGKIDESDIFPLDAMIREFKEETGLKIDNFELFSVITDLNQNGIPFRLYLYKTYIYDNPNEVSDKGEKLEFFNANDLPNFCIEDIKWMIPIARTTSGVVVVNKVYDDGRDNRDSRDHGLVGRGRLTKENLNASSEPCTGGIA